MTLSENPLNLDSFYTRTEITVSDWTAADVLSRTSWKPPTMSRSMDSRDYTPEPNRLRDVWRVLRGVRMRKMVLRLRCKGTLPEAGGGINLDSGGCAPQPKTGSEQSDTASSEGGAEAL